MIAQPIPLAEEMRDTTRLIKSKRMKTLICFLYSLLLATAAVYAAQPFPEDFRFRHYTVENGLSSNSIRSIIQDRKGYIWFGTEDGLNCYDGIQMKVYRTCKEKENVLGNNVINSLLEDNEGIIWVATDAGLYLYHPDKDAFRPFRSNIKITTITSSITQDKDGNIWFSTYGQGIFRYNKKNDELKQFQLAAYSNMAYHVYADSDNNIWVAGKHKNPSVLKLNRATDEFDNYPLIFSQVAVSVNSLVMFEDSSHALWIGTWDNGLQKVNRHTGETTTYLSPKLGNGILHIHSITEYASDILLIGSDDGLSLFNTTTGQHQLLIPNELSLSSLSDKFVYPIVKDKEGGIWIGTFYGGANYLSPRNGQFEGFVHSRFRNSLSGNIISRFCEDKEGRIWIASDDGGLSCYSPVTGLFTNYLPQEGRNSLSYHNVHALIFDDDNLWIGTYSGGLNILNTKTGQFKTYQSTIHDPTTLDQNSIYALFKDKSNNIWVTTMSGVNLYNRSTDNFTRVKDFGYLTIDIKQDTQGNIWFATQGKGLFKYNPTHQNWKNYTYTEASGSLIGNQVNSLYIDSSGTMWVGTTEGLCKYLPQKDCFESVSLDIESPNICCIIEEQHKLWITTTKGLIHYTPGEGCRTFTQSDGLQSDLFIANAGLKASDGRIYIGSVNGFNAFYPYRIHPNEYIPPVVFTGLEIFNREVPITENGVLPCSLNDLEQLNLAYDENFISIRFAALSYSIPGKNKYAYQLEGFDKDWNYVDKENKATYTNLPAGTYTFRVKASNNDGLWNEEGNSLKIVVHPPFYLTPFFKIGYFILVCLGLVMLGRFFLKRTEKKHTKEIAELNTRKEREVHEAKIQFFTMIAHEIRTPVSLIIGPLEKIMTSVLPIPSEVRSSLNIIDRNSQRLLFLVNQLLDFRKVDQEGTQLKCGRHQIHEIIKAVSDRFTPWVTQRGALFTIECPNEDFTAVVDREALTKIVSNLLTNASKYTKDHVVLRCYSIPEENVFIINVTDNGCGISPDEKEKIFQPFYQTSDNKPGTGIGLSIVHSLVEAHQGSINVQSEVGKGSSFIITLPLEQPEGVTGLTDSVVEVETNQRLPADILSETLPLEVVKLRPTMLIVDDNEEMLNFLSTSFTEEYCILTAEDGEQAIEKLKSNEVTLIVSDWMMPRMNGVELCKRVRSDQLFSHIPFILLTAKTDLNSKIEGMDGGADAYVEKPFSVQYLKSCIKNLIDLRNMLRQKFSKMPLVPIKTIASNSADDAFLTRMNELIEENFANPELSVDYLADHLCISRSGLFAKIKTLANVTPNELIQLIRLKKAATLLMENKYRVNEISYMVGFNNPSYFAKCFQKQFGVKPGEFTRKLNSPTPEKEKKEVPIT